jgi:hypothetical protein
MLQLMQSNHTPASSETGFLSRKWRATLFYLEKRSFERKLESVLGAAAGHEGNSLPVGDSRYQLLHVEANSLCTEFAERWSLDIDLLKARIAGLAKLERLSVPAQTMNYARLAYVGLVAIPLLCFLMGAVAGLANVGFHLVGGK